MANGHLTRAEVRRVDERAVSEFAMHSLVLMENAGRGCVDALQKRGIDGCVHVHCGKGNNGGDGFVIARHLDLRGYETRIFLWAEPEQLKGDALANYRIAVAAKLEIVNAGGLDLEAVSRQCGDADWEVDALLGTGVQGAPRAPADRAIEWINRRRRDGRSARVCAIDVPSGIDCDTGEAAGQAIVADLTLTFVAPKTGFQAAAAERYLGAVEVLDIGAPRIFVEQALHDS